MNDAFLKEETRCEYKVSEAIKAVWLVQLDLLEKFREVCERNGLNFFMAGGSLLGAIRHHGFIPWDDDIDLFMPRKDFEKLKEIASHEFKEPYFLQTEESDPNIYLGGFARLRNSNTTHIETWYLDSPVGNLGIWIDICILDFLYESPRLRRRQIRKIRYYQRMLFIKTYKEPGRFLEISPLYLKFLRSIAFFYSKSKIRCMLHKSLTSCQHSKYVTSFSYHTFRYLPFPFESEDFTSSIPMKFEWLTVPVPKGYDSILKLQYDDYNALPSPEKRNPHHTGIIDPYIPYKNYLLNFDWFLDGLADKCIVVFGAGKMLEYYLAHEGKKYPPDFAVDNDQNKWGTSVCGIPVQSPQSILTIPKEKLRLLICSIYYREIAKQLKAMGIDHYYIYVQNKDWL